MKKKMLLLMLLYGTLLAVSACGDTSATNADSGKVQQQEEVTEQESEIESAESKGDTLSGNKVSFTVDSEYSEGSIGYAYDEQQAKLKAVEEQAPEEYADFVFIIESLNSFAEPYVSSLNDPEASEEEKSAELAEVKAVVAEAKILKERFDEVEKTVNNIAEYEKLSARISRGLSYETYLE